MRLAVKVRDLHQVVFLRDRMGDDFIIYEFNKDGRQIGYINITAERVDELIKALRSLQREARNARQ